VESDDDNDAEMNFNDVVEPVMFDDNIPYENSDDDSDAEAKAKAKAKAKKKSGKKATEKPAKKSK
jgi:hypothetical protein